MQISDVVFGAWLVEGWPGLVPCALTPMADTAPLQVGMLSISAQAYRFAAANLANTTRTPAMSVGCFVVRPRGRVVLTYRSGVTAATQVQDLPRPPLLGGYAQVIHIASIHFIDADASTSQYRIMLDVDLSKARFSPDFHASVQNNPYQVWRPMS